MTSRIHIFMGCKKYETKGSTHLIIHGRSTLVMYWVEFFKITRCHFHLISHMLQTKMSVFLAGQMFDTWEIT